MSQPNVVCLLTDQWRLQALGYAGNTQVQTPNIDRLAGESLNFVHAVSGYSVCCPWRASFLTGQYPLTHGVIVNDVPMWRVGSRGHRPADTATLTGNPVGLGDAFKGAGYRTGYIGKWHVDGRGRRSFIPPERRLGFDYFKALECSHEYNQSAYYDNDDQTIRFWDGYDVFAQTADAQDFIVGASRRDARCAKPFLLVLSWGPPHNPYETAPPEYRELYNPPEIELRPNVPPAMADQAREWLAGYYAHCTAIDKSVGDIVDVLDKRGLADNTVLVFASDHGDMLGSQGEVRKQKPWEESIRVPFLLRYPAKFGREAREVAPFLNAHDIMPTLLGLCGLPIPDGVDGRDLSASVARRVPWTQTRRHCQVPDGRADAGSPGALLACFHPFGEWSRPLGGREYRGLRTARYTYCRTLQGPWLLYDNEADPYQLRNLCRVDTGSPVDQPDHAELLAELEALLQGELAAMGDEFLPGMDYIKKWGYPLDDTGTVPIR
ncbi:MAG: sulfatase [Chloroflexi bacterium]|nr:sulfatase [Chloroflexota bacterium]